jgi:glycosyltransferase involved in cell wall biosynthesis
MNDLLRDLEEYRLHHELEASVLIVDDGSGSTYDSFFQEASDLGATVIRNPANGGKGVALKTGYRFLIEKNTTQAIVCADCDGQHLPKDIFAVGLAAEEHPNTMVLGQRGFSGGVPLRSRIGNTITRIAFRMISGLPISDAQTGLRGYNAAMLPFLANMDGDRFEYEMNLLFRCKPDGYNCYEVPIETVYEDTKHHSSHFHTVRDTLSILGSFFQFGLREPVKFALSSTTAGLIDLLLYFLILLVLPLDLKEAIRLAIAIGAARLISAHVNYFINRKWVFRSSSNSSYFKYVALAIFVMLANYGIQALLVLWVAFPEWAGKLLTEAILISVSFLAQHLFVFRKKQIKS